MQSEGTIGDDTSPAALAHQQNYGSDDDDDEVPSSVPIVRPSNTLAFEEDDEGDELYDAAEAEAYSSDDDEVPPVANAWKLQAGGKAAKKKMTSKGSKMVSVSFFYIDDDDVSAIFE